MNIGYIRVSTEEQNTIRQENLMQELHIDKCFIDKVSGKTGDFQVLCKSSKANVTV
ncbi:recombinase family protein [Pectinatus brassicae]|uniref:DNA invertase Pin-like site-specific DNA recombinase n=1 Tax=Pectinatus brassicae TaxID=862415 RepID=A0A840UM03_9FIRM|nr:recombinase family protein [Pectinatus brassicae]MBB5335718.1 DNA invertase Pin-like site-specific DNA recombinase [Pectinatus brassicae]